MKKLFMLLGALLVVTVLGCGSSSKNTTEAKALPETVQKGKALVVYYSVPEATSPNNLTQEGENSTVVKEGKLLGNTQYVAGIIAKTIGAEEFRIETEQKYPINDHKAFIDKAKEELNNNFRPTLVGKPNLAQYEVVFLGYPNWWGDMPMALYSFLEQNDFTGKTIIPFNTHGGSGLSRTVDSIAAKAPKATVVKDAFTVHRGSVANCEGDVKAWLGKLGYK